jgi:hypothetical protein
MNLIQKPCKFIRQHSEDCVVVQLPCVTVLDLPIIKDIMIESLMLVPLLSDVSTM